MYRYLSFFLAILIAGSACRDIMPMIDYYFNRDYFRDVLCINRDKPEMKCAGKCHLKKVLVASHSQDQSKPFPPPHENTPVTIPVCKVEVESIPASAASLHIIHPGTKLLPGISSKIMQPPEISA